MTGSDKVQIKWTEHIPDYLVYLHGVASNGAADHYRDGGRIVQFEPNSGDVAHYHPLGEFKEVYLVYRRADTKGVVL